MAERAQLDILIHDPGQGAPGAPGAPSPPSPTPGGGGASPPPPPGPSPLPPPPNPSAVGLLLNSTSFRNAMDRVNEFRQRFRDSQTRAMRSQDRMREKTKNRKGLLARLFGSPKRRKRTAASMVGGMRQVGGFFSEFARQSSLMARNAPALEQMGSAAQMAGGMLSKLGPAGAVAGGALQMFGGAFSAISQMNQAFIARAREIGGFSGAIVSAQVRSDIAKLRRNITEAQNLGEDYGKLIDSQTDLDDEMAVFNERTKRRQLGLGTRFNRNTRDFLRAANESGFTIQDYFGPAGTTDLGLTFGKAVKGEVLGIKQALDGLRAVAQGIFDKLPDKGGFTGDAFFDAFRGQRWFGDGNFAPFQVPPAPNVPLPPGAPQIFNF